MGVGSWMDGWTDGRMDGPMFFLDKSVGVKNNLVFC